MAAALMLAGAAHAEGTLVEIAWDARGRFEHTQPLAPGRFVEVCGALPAGSTVRWRFEAHAAAAGSSPAAASAPAAPGAAALDFNIHYHEGRRVIYPARLTQAARGADTLVVAQAQDYCWMWTHKGARSLELRTVLERTP